MLIFFLNYAFIVSSQGVNDILLIFQPNLCLYLNMIKLPKAMLCMQVRICYYAKSWSLFCIKTDNNSPYEVCNFSKSSSTKYVLIFKDITSEMAGEKLCQLKGISAPFLVLGLLCTKQLQVFHPERPDLSLKTELTLTRAFGPEGSRGSFQHKLLYEQLFPRLLLWDQPAWGQFALLGAHN